MFSVPVSFVGFPGEPRRFPRGHTSYRVTTHRSPGGWTYHESGLPHHAIDLDPFMRAPASMWSQGYVPKKPTEWTDSVVCTGFAPDEVSLKVSSDKVFVRCFHKDGDEENYDTREKKMTVKIPDDVESGDIKAEMSEGGTLTLKAPYVQIEEAPEDAGAKKDGGEKSASSEEKQEKNKDKKSTNKDGTTSIKISRS